MRPLLVLMPATATMVHRIWKVRQMTSSCGRHTFPELTCCRKPGRRHAGATAASAGGVCIISGGEPGVQPDCALCIRHPAACMEADLAAPMRAMASPAA